MFFFVQKYTVIPFHLKKKAPTYFANSKVQNYNSANDNDKIIDFENDRFTVRLDRP